MKYTTTLILLLLFSLFSFSQKKFEGTIIYAVHDNEGKGDHELTALFGNSGIKIKFGDSSNYDKDVLLINLDSGSVYHLNDQEKTYTASPLKIKKPKLSLADKMFAGYNAKPVDYSNEAGYMGSLAGLGGNIVLYRSDSLYYPIPDRYSVNPELSIVNSNYIVLGAEVSLGMSFAMDEDKEDSQNETQKNLITISASQIKWQNVDEKELQLPVDYKKLSYNSYLRDSTAIADTSVMLTDTVALKPVKPVQKTAPKPVSKSKNKTKTVPNKEIRKPDQ